MAGAAVAEVWSFPTDISEFDEDDRISFSKLDGKYIAVQEDGAEFEFDETKKRWVPHEEVVGDDSFAQDYFAHSAPTVPAAPTGAARQPLSAKDGHSAPDSVPKPNKKGKSQAPPKPKQNTAVYVTGLPVDATADEVADLFSRKCGVIAEEIDSGRPRIKMYTDANGDFKGDALIVFFKPQSVDMAIMLLDDTDFRFTPTPSASAGRMHVQAADVSYKKTNYQSEATSTGSGPLQPSRPATKRKADDSRGASQDKQRIIKKTQKLDAKLADWSSDEERPYSYGDGGKRNPKWDKVVVLKHMFTLKEVTEDPAAVLEIKEDIREECSKLGEVTNVVLYDKEEAGIVTVKFKEPAAATACLRLMDGRAFDGQIVEATLATGREKYRKSKDDDSDGED